MLVSLILVTTITTLLSGITTTEMETLYEEGVNLYKEGKYVGASDCFMSILIQEPENNSAKTYLKKSVKAICESRKKEIERQRKLMAYNAQKFLFAQSAKKKKKKLYKAALKNYKKKQYLFASDKLKKIISITPGYREAGKYLDILEKKMEKIAEGGIASGNLQSYALGYVN